MKSFGNALYVNLIIKNLKYNNQYFDAKTINIVMQLKNSSHKKTFITLSLNRFKVLVLKYSFQYNPFRFLCRTNFIKTPLCYCFKNFSYQRKYQKQPSTGVHLKRFSENIHEFYTRTPVLFTYMISINLQSNVTIITL